MEKPGWDAYLRIIRAGEHLRDLEGRVKTYLEGEREVTFLKIEGKTATIVGEQNLPPSELSIVAGEIVYNLRAALDYLVFQLAANDSGSIQEQTQFPIEDSPKDFRRRRNHRLKGVSDEHVAAIEALQPYNGHKWIALLRDISNSDKHSQLAFSGFVASGPRIERKSAESDAEVIGGETFKVPGDVGVYCKLTFAVALSGQPVPQLFHEIQTQVRAVLDSFELPKIYGPALEQRLNLTSAYL